MIFTSRKQFPIFKEFCNTCIFYGECIGFIIIVALFFGNSPTKNKIKLTERKLFRIKNEMTTIKLWINEGIRSQSNKWFTKRYLLLFLFSLKYTNEAFTTRLKLIRKLRVKIEHTNSQKTDAPLLNFQMFGRNARYRLNSKRISKPSENY